MWFSCGGWELLGDFLRKMTTEGGEGKVVCVRSVGGMLVRQEEEEQNELKNSEMKTVHWLKNLP